MKTIRSGVLVALLLMSATLAQAQGTQLLVSNVEVQQRQFTATWDVTYDLETVGDIAVTVSLFLSTDSGATYPNLCATVSGDVGAGVLPGASRHIVWNASTDFPGFSNPTCRLRVTADDGQIEVPAGFVSIPPGTFIMGSPEDEPGRNLGETQHQVTLTHGVYVQTTEVTNQQYRDMAQWAYDRGYVTVTADCLALVDNLDGSTWGLKTLGDDGQGTSSEITFSAGVFSCVNPTRPVNRVTWWGSAAYCDWLSLQQGLPRAYSHSTWECNAGNPYTATGYRLPTEAEWEYACRAGTQTPYNTGSFLAGGTQANYRGTWTMPVGSYPANAFGLYDMHGNLMEWCNDWLGTYGGTVTDPVGAGAGSNRVLRGGGWVLFMWNCRSALRDFDPPYNQIYDIGFRPVRSAN
jgi:formylglycine-generating enzyme required for sulfatase activity